MSAHGRCFCGCPRKAGQRHHVVYEQEVRRAGGVLSDPRNLVSVAVQCHAAHHSRKEPFRMHMLPDSVFEFAAELLGSGAAFEYLSRRYRGGDPRHDALIEADQKAA